MRCCHADFSLLEGSDRGFTLGMPTFTFGRGVLHETGEHAREHGLRRVGLFTDPRLAGSEHVASVRASLAAAGVATIGLFDAGAAAAEGLAERLRRHYPAIEVRTGSNDPAGYALVVNATPLGMKDGDPLPMDVSRIAPSTLVGEVVMKQEMTAFLRAVEARGCRFQVGTDMLFEQIPAYLEFFGFPTTTPENLRAVARLSY